MRFFILWRWYGGNVIHTTSHTTQTQSRRGVFSGFGLNWCQCALKDLFTKIIKDMGIRFYMPIANAIFIERQIMNFVNQFMDSLAINRYTYS
jgi:hypothetical protein